MFVEGCRGVLFVRRVVAEVARERSVRLYQSLSGTSRHRFAVVTIVRIFRMVSSSETFLVASYLST